jgi:hypothetical protein
LLFVLAASAGCGAVDQAELARTKAELEEARAQIRTLKADMEKMPAKSGYLDELERLEALRSKGVLTPDEFQAKKKAALEKTEGPKEKAEGPKQTASAYDDLDKQLRIHYGLFEKGTINNLEWNAKKQQLLKKPLSSNDPPKDLEKGKALFESGIINNLEWNDLKTRLLAIGSAGPEKK